MRLVEAAARLFAAKGFKNVTVRDISKRARANVASVNYHFRNKLGLYKEVVRLVASRMDAAKEDAIKAGEGQPAEEQLRTYIRVNLQNLLGHDADSWMDKLLGREMSDPSPAFDLIVERGIKPDAVRLGRLLSQLLGCSPKDDRVWRCALSIRAQFLFYAQARPVFARMAPGFKFTQEVVDQIADHISDFSLAGIRALAKKSQGANAAATPMTRGQA